MKNRLFTNKEIQMIADKHSFAVGAFNVFDLESVQAVATAAKLEDSPAIIATTEGAIEYAGLRNISTLVKIASEESYMPFSLHLDHGKNLETIKACLDAGYSSVMIDGSTQDFESNISLTKKVVAMAHRKGASVEAELGTIGGVEDNASSRNILLTDPLKAKEFAEKSGCDTLAVAIGTSHGAYKFAGESKLDIPRLAAIHKAVKVPLVLHGASGVPSWVVEKASLFGALLGKPQGVSDADIKHAIIEGISKVNIDSDLRLTFDAKVREVLKTKPAEFDPRKILGPAREGLTDMVRFKMRLFGSSGKAQLYRKAEKSNKRFYGRALRLYK